MFTHNMEGRGLRVLGMCDAKFYMGEYVGEDHKTGAVSQTRTVNATLICQNSIPIIYHDPRTERSPSKHRPPL